MIKLRWNSKRPVCLCCAACLSVMLFFGCSAGNAGNSTSPVLPSATPSASLPAASVSPSPPSVSELPEALPAPSATPFAVNPVYAFYAEYHADCAALLDAYAAGLSALQSVDGLSYSLALTEHRALLSEGRITIARLFGSDESGYSGALESAASRAAEACMEARKKAIRFSFPIQTATRCREVYPALRSASPSAPQREWSGFAAWKKPGTLGCPRPALPHTKASLQCVFPPQKGKRPSGSAC